MGIRIWADSIVYFCDNSEDFQVMLEDTMDCLDSYGLHISNESVEYIEAGSDEPGIDFVLDVDEVHYKKGVDIKVGRKKVMALLGSKLCSDGSTVDEQMEVFSKIKRAVYILVRKRKLRQHDRAGVRQWYTATAGSLRYHFGTEYVGPALLRKCRAVERGSQR